MSTRRTLALVLGLSLFVAACGDDDEPDAAGAATTSGDGSAPGSATTAAAGTASEDTAATTGAAPTTGTATPATTAADEGAGCEATQPGTQINFGVFAPATQIDPTLASGGLVGGHELAAVYDVLFRFDYESNEYVPHLAESITPNDDFTVWTLKLREGIAFSDGTPLTAELVAGNFERFFSEEAISPGAGYLSPVTKSTPLDETTLEITLSKPWAEFPFVLANVPGMVVNPNAIGGDLAAFAADPPDAAGLGPYLVERNAPNEELVLKARDDYWGGPVCVETVRFVFVPGAQATYAAFSNEELDLAFLRDPAVIDKANADGRAGHFVQQDSGDALLVNQAEGRPGIDPLVREAIALAIDPQIVNDRAYGGALQTGSALIQEGSRFYSDAVEPAPFDPERATQLVEEAKADGFDGSVGLSCQSAPPAPDRALAVEGMLNAVGIEVETQLLPQVDLITQVATGDYDVACWGVNAGPDTAMTSMERNFRSDAASNRVAYKSEEMDAALDALLADPSPETMAEVNRIYVQDHPMVTIGALEEGAVWQERVQGVVPSASTVFLLHDAYIEE